MEYFTGTKVYCFLIAKRLEDETMETVTLSKIVRTITPKWQPILTSLELQSQVVLQHGLTSLSTEDVLEIIEASIGQFKGTGVLFH